jgi:transcription-repair coupling factor (superfamily II helicase)
MVLSGLLSLIDSVPSYRRLIADLLGAKYEELKLVAPNSGRPYLIAALCRKLLTPAIVVTPQMESAKRLVDELQIWSPPSTSIRLFPEPDPLKGRNGVNGFDTVRERMEVLSMLAFWSNGVNAGVDRPLIISTASAAASKTVSKSDLARTHLTVHTGMEVEPLQLIHTWQTIGYELENTVEVPGTISRRGGIVDVFPITGELPARIEFFGNTIDTIRLFDPKTQRSVQPVEHVTIAPAREDYGKSENYTILDYLPKNALLVMEDADEFDSVIDMVNALTDESYNMDVDGDDEFCMDSPFISSVEFRAKTDNAERKLLISSWSPVHMDTDAYHTIPFNTVVRYGGRLESFIEDLKKKLQANNRVLIVSQQTNRLSELLVDNDIPAYQISDIDYVPDPGTVSLVHGSMADGWALDSILTLYTDNELFGFVKKRRLSKRRNVRHHLFAHELNRGDYVVHIEHGIGKYIGLSKVQGDKSEQEYLVLEYAAGDKLYVPVDQIDRISRYIGGGDQSPRLTRLGTQEWIHTKNRIKKSVADMAEELLNLYAARETVKGFSFSPDSYWQQELESSFPYVETPDQLEAVQAVKNDMERSRPMDRLVCGDVGYGKTEIALRAAFKAVMDNKQVALLVPTTVLARQHFFTFKERLQAFPVRVEVLSRLSTNEDEENIIEGLASGQVDVCIGTHRLLQKDIIFKDLGLLIIDEEQRFGVSHKEYFKKMRREIDVLTLSATPIPRTLHMSLAGIRDLSTIDTPPEDRLPVTTHVGFFNEQLVREAILRELERNGQVFFVHNRVKSIGSVAHRLGVLVPEAKISVAHGQLKEEELEKIMTDFINRDIDVLVTTTIIELGLDMPNVNTIVIDKSDRLGLSQLYQLRGRVGRGDSNAYAYYLFDRGKQLTSPAKQRLSTISEATELGAGFAIAMRDLEIRGAGNLLGAEQSGYITVVGFDLYCTMLSEAIDELRSNRKKDKEYETQLSKYTIPVDLPMKYYIPENYIVDTASRIRFYQRLANVHDISDISEISGELKDRFGTLPDAVINLLFAVEIRLLAGLAQVESILTKDKHIVVLFSKGKSLSTVHSKRGYIHSVKVGGRQIRLSASDTDCNWRQILKAILDVEVENKGN